jgi:type IV pilus assembly protein PilM
MAQSVLGVNMGNHSVKVVELARRGNSFIVQNLLIAPTQEAIVEGEVIQPDVLGQILRDLLRSAGVKTRSAIVSVGGQRGVIVRVTELPKMSRRELTQAIPLEIERHLPFQSGAAVQAYTLLKEPEEVAEGEQIPVLFAAAREDLVDAYLMALKEAGLSPIGVEAEPLALARAVYAAQGFGVRDGQGDQISVVVNIGYEGTEISFLEGAKLIFTRLVPVGGRHLTEDIRDHLGLSTEEAERLKIEEGTAWIEQPPTPTPPTMAGAETQVIPPAPPPMATEPLPTFEMPSAEVPSSPETLSPAISFDLPTEATPSPDLSAESPPSPAAPPALDFSLEFEPSPPTTSPSPPTPPSPPSPTVTTPLEFGAPTPSAPEQVTPGLWTPGEGEVTGSGWEAPAVPEVVPLHVSIYNAMSGQLLSLADEIVRSVEFLASQRPNLTVARIYLAGGGALLRDLDRFLQERLGVSVERLNPFQYMDVSPVAGRFGHDYLEQTAPLYAVAVGLALWAYL